MNAERKNDLTKLAYHRMVARALRRVPVLMDEARAIVRAQKLQPVFPPHVDEWDALLARPVSEVCREITRRTPSATRLRIDSPFYLTPTRAVSDSQRLRLREIASRLVSAH
jgi:hypothetical protein